MSRKANVNLYTSVKDKNHEVFERVCDSTLYYGFNIHSDHPRYNNNKSKIQNDTHNYNVVQNDTDTKYTLSYNNRTDEIVVFSKENGDRFIIPSDLVQDIISLVQFIKYKDYENIEKHMNKIRNCYRKVAYGNVKELVGYNGVKFTEPNIVYFTIFQGNHQFNYYYNRKEKKDYYYVSFVDKDSCRATIKDIPASTLSELCSNILIRKMSRPS